MAKVTHHCSGWQSWDSSPGLGCCGEAQLEGTGQENTKVLGLRNQPFPKISGRVRNSISSL